MKILIVSHNVFSLTESVGRTLSSCFSEFEPDLLSQFYIHSQVPTMNICHNYYRITDKEAIASIFGKKVGTIFGKESIEKNIKKSRTDTGKEHALYQYARKRTPIIYFMRNTWWKFSHWNTCRFRNWVNNFKPDCIFLASGDYAFLYDVARKIAKLWNIPIYVYCMDDYYIQVRDQKKILGRLQHRLFMRSVRKTIEYSSAIFCICEKMAKDYNRLFDKPCYTMHTIPTIKNPLVLKKKDKISYVGTLGYQRDKQLIVIGRTLKKMGECVDHIDVYSTETRKEIIDNLTKENGIVFHGAADSDEVMRIIGESMAVIHTESFDEDICNAVRYSISTKIADLIVSGTYILAYGPQEVASMEYIKNCPAAYCATNPNNLEVVIRSLIKAFHNEPYAPVKQYDNSNIVFEMLHG